jgi:hypothetical protein
MKAYFSKSATLCLLNTLAALLFVFILLCVKTHDWDVDAFLYLGSRLNFGELLYQNDFETKMPIVQYLFWIPAQLGGVGAWRIFSLLATASALGAASCKLKDVFAISPWIVVPAFLIQAMVLPGGPALHFSILAGSLIFFVLACYGQPTPSRTEVAAAGVLFAMAATMRLNYLFILPVLLIADYVFRDKETSWFSGIARNLYFLAGFLLGLVLEFSPYIASGGGQNKQILLSGIRSILAFDRDSKLSWAQRFSALFSNQSGWNNGIEDCVHYAPYYLALCLLCALTAYAFVKTSRQEHQANRSVWKLCAIALCSVLALEISFAKSHYYSHYALLFLPFGAILLSALLMFATKTDIVERIPAAKLLVKLAAFSVAIELLVGTGNLFYEFAQDPFFSLKINARNYNEGLLARLAEIKMQGMSFYAPENTNYHRILGEPRIGDGHPAILHDVLDGKRIGPLPSIGLFTRQAWENPCLAFRDSGKDFIFLSKTEAETYPQEYGCIVADGKYRDACEEQSTKVGICSYAKEYMIFQRTR